MSFVNVVIFQFHHYLSCSHFALYNTQITNTQYVTAESKTLKRY